MAKIKSTRQAILIPKEQISGTLLIEMNSPVHDILSGNIRCNINYFLMEESRLISNETWNIPSDKSLILLEACLNNKEGIDNLLTGFLLEKFQEKSVYGILPEEWIISNEQLEQRPSE